MTLPYNGLHDKLQLTAKDHPIFRMVLVIGQTQISSKGQFPTFSHNFFFISFFLRCPSSYFFSFLLFLSQFLSALGSTR